MSEATDEIREIADAFVRGKAIFDWIAANEDGEDKARTLADNEVIGRCAQKLVDAADFFDGNVEDPDA